MGEAELAEPEEFIFFSKSMGKEILEHIAKCFWKIGLKILEN